MHYDRAHHHTITPGRSAPALNTFTGAVALLVICSLLKWLINNLIQPYSKLCVTLAMSKCVVNIVIIDHGHGNAGDAGNAHNTIS